METGEVSQVLDCGTIILVVLQAEQGRPVPIPFDRRMFRTLLDGEGLSANELLGRRASYDGDTFRVSD
jgi:hypothetical protein